MRRWLLGLLTILFSLTAQAQYVTLQGNLYGANGATASNYTLSFTPSQTFYVAGTGVFIGNTTTCATSVDGSVVGIPNPLQASVVTPQFSGTLPAGNYYLFYTFYDALNSTETLPSPEIIAQLTSTGQLTIAGPTGGVPTGATARRIYVGSASGSETLQGQGAGNNSYVLSVPLVSGATPPTTNNTICQQVANDAGWPTGTGYNVALTDASGNAVPGYPMQWQLLGPNTTINLSNGVPYYHGIVNFPSPILATPYNHNIQSILGPINMSGYPLLNVGSITSAVVNSTVNAGACASITTKPSWCTGSDIGAWVNAALTSCSQSCEIYIPAGSYQQTTSISLPLNLYGEYILTGSPGAVVNYTGSSDAIVTPIGPTGLFGQSQLLIQGFQLFGTSAATSAIHTYPTNRISIRNMIIQGFSSGDGIKVEGTNSANIYDNLITNNLNGVHLIPTICSASYPYTCSSTGSGPNVYTPNAIHIFANQIADNIHWGIFDDRNQNAGGLTGSLNNLAAYNDLENNGLGTSAYGSFYAMHSYGWIIEANYFEGSPRAVVLGELGAGSSLETNGAQVINNYFTTQPPVSPATTRYNIELENAFNTTISGNSELIAPGTGGNNCDINAATSGETQTYIGRNNFTQTSPFGSLICINGTGAPQLIGAGSYSAMNTQYQAYMADQFFQINTSVTSESVGVTNMTVNGSCQLAASVGNSTAINAGAASIFAGTSKVSAVGAGGITVIHPSGTAMTYDVLCENNPTGGYQ